MAEFNKYIGLDVHKEKISVAVADQGRMVQKLTRRFPMLGLWRSSALYREYLGVVPRHWSQRTSGQKGWKP